MHFEMKHLKFVKERKGMYYPKNCVQMLCRYFTPKVLLSVQLILFMYITILISRRKGYLKGLKANCMPCVEERNKRWFHPKLNAFPFSQLGCSRKGY